MTAKQKRQKTGLEYLLQMKEYLGDDDMQAFVESEFPHRTAETKRGMINAVNRVHAAKRGHPAHTAPAVEGPINTPKAKKPNRFSIRNME